MSIYEKVGEETFSLAVTLFYTKVLRDKRINYFFEGTELSTLLNHQTKFLTVALGGSNKYLGKSLADAHRPLVENMGLSDTHYNIITKHLQSTLEELRVEPSIVSTIINTVEGFRDQVLCRD